MDKKCCIIFPNQLFRESIFIDSDYKIFLIEEDLFFNQYNFHKQKISVDKIFDKQLNQHSFHYLL